MPFNSRYVAAAVVFPCTFCSLHFLRFIFFCIFHFLHFQRLFWLQRILCLIFSGQVTFTLWLLTFRLQNWLISVPSNLDIPWLSILRRAIQSQLCMPSNLDRLLLIKKTVPAFIPYPPKLKFMWYFVLELETRTNRWMDDHMCSFLKEDYIITRRMGGMIT